MHTRKLIIPSLASSAAALMGLFSQQAAAAEEIVVSGADIAEAREAPFRLEIDEYVRALNEQIKVRMDEDFKHVSAPKLILADSEILTRG